MKEFFRPILEDKQTQRFFIISFGIIILTLLYSILNFSSLPPYIPVFNQLPWGNERIISNLGIFIPILLSLGIFVFNLFFCSFVYKKNPLIARLFAVTSFLIALMSFLFIIRTIQIVL